MEDTIMTNATDDLVERLRSGIPCRATLGHGESCSEGRDWKHLCGACGLRRQAAAEIERLRAELARLNLRLRWQDERVATHYDDCWRDHRECAMAKIERAEAERDALLRSLIDENSLRLGYRFRNGLPIESTAEELIRAYAARSKP